MGYEHENITYKGHNIIITNDEDPQNPRTEWDNLTEIHCCSSRYYLGEHNHKDWDACREAIAEHKRNGAVVIDLYAYIHSGTRLSLASFHGRLPQGHAEFDSGKCGFVVVPKKGIIENWGKKNWTDKLRARAYEVAKQDIETFNQYLAGEVYCYSVDDYEDSCSGYYSIEDAMAEAKGIVDWKVAKDIKAHFDQLKTWIKNKVPLYVRTTYAHTVDPI